jgi:competence protein ComGC
MKTNLKSHKNILHSKFGMTLVEIILAMAILGMIVILMTPVMVNGFRMVTLSGDRHGIAKNVAGDVEDNLAGETVTASLSDVVVDLPGGISVDGKTYELNQGSDARYVDLWGYIIGSMAVFEPTGTTSSTTPTSTSATTETSSSETSGSETSETTAAPTTTAPTQPAIELKDVIINVEKWRNDSVVNKTGVILNTTNIMEYHISEIVSGSIVQNWTTCNNTQTIINLPYNSIDYLVVVRQSTNPANNKHLRIRKAPWVAFHKINDQFTNFYIYDTVTLSFREIKTSDAVELILTPSDTWTLVVTGKRVKNLDTSYVYSRFAASINSDGFTIDDPASFPAKVTSYQ